MESLGGKILIVDPCKSIRGLTISSLRKLGFKEFIEASDCVNGSEIIEKKDIGIVFCEIFKEEFDTFKFYEKICSIEKTIRPIFIIVTSNLDMEQISKIQASGIKNVLVKPFNLSQLQNSLKKALAKK